MTSLRQALHVYEAMPRGHTVFGGLSRLPGHQDWFAGDVFSLADLMIAIHVDFFEKR